MSGGAPAPGGSVGPHRSGDGPLWWQFGDDAILIEGVEDYPAGGGLPTDELVYAISGGTGAYAGVRGEARITYDAATQRFTYRLALAD